MLIPIKRVTVLGDSLTDRGSMHKTILRPMAFLGRPSHNARFTNAYGWSDHFGNILVQQIILAQLGRDKSKPATTDDIGLDKNKTQELLKQYTLTDDKKISYQNTDVLRTFAIGGLTAWDSSTAPLSSRLSFFLSEPKLAFTREILSSLAKQRDLLTADDIKAGKKPEDFKDDLIVEWSASNDLMTINSRPSIDAANKALVAREQNIEQLISQGYSNFVLINLPNISLTPRYQKLNPAAQAEAEQVFNYFNQNLATRISNLQQKYPNLSITLFDVNPPMREIKVKYREKALKILTDEKNVLASVNDASSVVHVPSEDEIMKKMFTMMFWDDVHPTSDVHAEVAEAFYKYFTNKFELIPPSGNSSESKLKPRI